MELAPPPSGLETEYRTLFTTESLLFLHKLISMFDKEVDEVGVRVQPGVCCMSDLIQLDSNIPSISVVRFYRDEFIERLTWTCLVTYQTFWTQLYTSGGTLPGG